MRRRRFTFRERVLFLFVLTLAWGYGFSIYLLPIYQNYFNAVSISEKTPMAESRDRPSEEALSKEIALLQYKIAEFSTLPAVSLSIPESHHFLDEMVKACGGSLQHVQIDCKDSGEGSKFFLRFTWLGNYDQLQRNFLHLAQSPWSFQEEKFSVRVVPNLNEKKILWSFEAFLAPRRKDTPSPSNMDSLLEMRNPFEPH